MKKPVRDLEFESGEILLFNKPKGWTSFDVVAKVRNNVPVKKVGHAGTLDPLATGLLIICAGKKATKQIPRLQEGEKEYHVDMFFGATTASYDLEKEPENFKDTGFLNRKILEDHLPDFRGVIDQIPPVFSAVKVKGQRAYKAARRGEEIKLKSRKVLIKEFEITEFNSPENVKARVVCSKGTYIRSLVNDLGAALGSGAYMSGLVRTRIGDYNLKEAWEVSDFIAEMKALKDS